jgi:hypothetical protein
VAQVHRSIGCALGARRWRRASVASRQRGPNPTPARITGLYHEPTVE